jgi:hypothetical protein
MSDCCCAKNGFQRERFYVWKEISALKQLKMNALQGKVCQCMVI